MIYMVHIVSVYYPFLFLADLCMPPTSQTEIQNNKEDRAVQDHIITCIIFNNFRYFKKYKNKSNNCQAQSQQDSNC